MTTPTPSPNMPRPEWVREVLEGITAGEWQADTNVEQGQPVGIYIPDAEEPDDAGLGSLLALTFTGTGASKRVASVGFSGRDSAAANAALMAAAPALAQAYLDLKSQNESLTAQVARLEKREARHALLFGVPDGGQYEADWESRAAEFRGMTTRKVLVDSGTLVKMLDVIFNVQNMTQCCEACMRCGEKHDFTTPFKHEDGCPVPILQAELAAQPAPEAGKSITTKRGKWQDVTFKLPVSMVEEFMEKAAVHGSPTSLIRAALATYDAIQRGALLTTWVDENESSPDDDLNPLLYGKPNHS